MVEVSVFSDIIYQMNATENEARMRTEFLQRMSQVIAFDSADFFLARHDGVKGLENPVTFQCDPELVQRYEILDYSMIMMYSGESMVYRESDILHDEQRVKSDYYQRVYQPNGWHYALQFLLGYRETFYGCATFYRKLGQEDFSQEDVEILSLFKRHMALRLYQDSITASRKTPEEMIAELDKERALTKKEKQIVLLLATGTPNLQICTNLDICGNTLNKHLLHIYEKLNLAGKVELLSKFI